MESSSLVPTRSARSLPIEAPPPVMQSKRTVNSLLDQVHSKCLWRPKISRNLNESFSKTTCKGKVHITKQNVSVS